MTGLEDISKFNAALRKFVQEICAVFGEIGVPERQWRRIVHEEEGWSFPEEKRSDYLITLLLVIARFHEKPPTSLLQILDIVRNNPSLSNLLLIDAGGNRIQNENMQLYWLTYVFTNRFMTKYFEKAKKIEFDDNVFVKVLTQLQQDMDTPVIAVKELSPLINANMDCEKIEITGHLTIRKLTLYELEKWLNTSPMDPSPLISRFPLRGVTHLNCAIEVIYEQQKNQTMGSNHAIRMETDDLVTTLRLLTDKNICTAFTERDSNSILQPGGAVIYSHRPPLLGHSANLGTYMQADIIESFKRIRALSNESPLRLALRRWNSVFERFDENDALVDYWIALEGLFIPDAFQELRHRSAFRIGSYIGENSDQREQVYKDLLESYDLRSRIVHGGVPTNKRKTELINITRAYLRRSLMKILSSKDGFDATTIEIERLRK